MREYLTGFLAGLVLMMAGVPALAQEGNGFSALPPACGTEPIMIAGMQWPSSAVLAEVHAQILRREYGCVSDVVPGDMTASSSSMATTGQPAMIPELWLNRVTDVWNSAIENQSVRQAGTSYDATALEGWFIPDFVAANHPGLTSAAGLKDYWQVFRAGNSGKAKFISCPPDWACAVINRNMLKALGLSEQFEIVEPANRFELDTLIAEAVSRREAIIFYYWQPNAVLSQLSFRQLDLGAYDAAAAICLARRACAVPMPSAFVPEPVVIALADWVFAEAPQVAGYFQRAQMPVGEMNALLAWQSEQGSTPGEAAAHFIATRENVWRPWLGNY